MAKKAVPSKSAKPSKAAKPRKSAKAAQEDGSPIAVADPAEKRAVYLAHLKKIKAAKRELDAKTEERRAANTAYASSLKDAKKAGVDIDDLRTVLGLMEREPDEVSVSFTNINNYLLWAGVPVGTQLGLFADGETVASKVDAERLDDGDFDKRPISTARSIAEAKTGGFDAGSDGKSRSANPYPEGSPEFLAWNAEYDRAQAKIAHGMARNGAEAHAAA